MAARFTRIEPGHDGLRLRGATLRETKHRVLGWPITLGTGCEKRRNQHGVIGVEDADLKMIVNLVWQHEHVGSRRQHASGNLNGLADRKSTRLNSSHLYIS